MVDEKNAFKTWQDVIIDFFETRISKSELFKARSFIEKEEKKILSESNPAKRDRIKKSLSKKISELAELRKQAPFTEIRDWINKVTDKNNTKAPIKKSHRILKATHVMKFIHTSANAGSILNEGKTPDPYITTASFYKLVPDFAHNDGALISVSRFLALNLSEKTIFDCIKEDNFDFLEGFKKNESEFKNWKEVFSQVVNLDNDIKINKAKQLYFPISKREVGSYHLLAPLFPSSVSEKIYNVVRESKFLPKHNNLFHTNKSTYIPNVATIQYGGEYPRNVSMLNANRGGISYLFSSQPPTWQSQLQPPIKNRRLFDKLHNDSIETEIDYLCNHLLLGLSIKEPKRKVHIERWVNNIIDEFLFYVSSIQNLPAGWSATEGIKLTDEHQYLLDPYREDESFQSARHSTNWQVVIGEDFARWLNNKLHKKDNRFTPQTEHRKLWQELVEQPLREHMKLIEEGRKQRMTNNTEVA